MNTIVRTARRTTDARRLVLNRFDFFTAEEGEENANDRARLRYRMLLFYGCEHCLTAEEQETIRGYYREGKSLVRLSEELGIPVSTLSRRLNRARRKLMEFTEQADAVRQICHIAEQ